jgi:hypothetical protein
MPRLGVRPQIVEMPRLGVRPQTAGMDRLRRCPNAMDEKEENQSSNSNGKQSICKATTPRVFLPLGTARFTAVTAPTAGVR